MPVPRGGTDGELRALRVRALPGGPPGDRGAHRHVRPAQARLAAGRRTSASPSCPGSGRRGTRSRPPRASWRTRGTPSAWSGSWPSPPRTTRPRSACWRARLPLRENVAARRGRARDQGILPACVGARGWPFSPPSPSWPAASRARRSASRRPRCSRPSSASRSRSTSTRRRKPGARSCASPSTPAAHPRARAASSWPVSPGSPSLRRAAECDPRPTGAVEATTRRPAVIVTAGPIEWNADDEAWVGRHLLPQREPVLPTTLPRGAGARGLGLAGPILLDGPA